MPVMDIDVLILGLASLLVTGHHMPRTTLALDDKAFELAKHYAETRSLTLGKAVSDLVLRGARAGHAVREINKLLVFDLPHDSPRITPAHVKRIESDPQ